MKKKFCSLSLFLIPLVSYAGLDTTLQNNAMMHLYSPGTKNGNIVTTTGQYSVPSKNSTIYNINNNDQDFDRTEIVVEFDCSVGSIRFAPSNAASMGPWVKAHQDQLNYVCN